MIVKRINDGSGGEYKVIIANGKVFLMHERKPVCGAAVEKTPTSLLDKEAQFPANYEMQNTSTK